MSYLPVNLVFLKEKRTDDAFGSISDLIHESLDKSETIIVTFLDLAKAFDKAAHKILIKKT